MHYNMELPDFWLVAWVILVLDFVFLFIIFMLLCVLMEVELIVLRFGFSFHTKKTSIQKTTNG